MPTPCECKNREPHIGEDKQIWCKNCHGFIDFESNTELYFPKAMSERTAEEKCTCEVLQPVFHSAGCLTNKLDTVRAEADRLRQFAKRAVEALRDCAYGGRCHEADNQGTSCGMCTDRADAILTDPICVEIMKEAM